jgi:putative ATP-binding cassette transporter
LARLTWVTSGYDWLVIVAPFAMAAPGYFSGRLTLGALMIVVGAFTQVQGSLRWFVHNFSKIADWRATQMRIVAMREALRSVESLDAGDARITLTRTSRGQAFPGEARGLSAGLGWRMHDPRREGDMEIGAGEYVQLTGETAVGKTTLFLALAGL